MESLTRNQPPSVSSEKAVPERRLFFLPLEIPSRFLLSSETPFLVLLSECYSPGDLFQRVTQFIL